MDTSSSRLTAARLPAKPPRVAARPLEPFSRPAHSSGIQSAYSTLGIPRIDPATWGNLPHNRCRQTLFLPWPRETPEKLIVKAVLIERSRYPNRPFGLRPITMPSGSLIPDRQLTFSPELAETIGLEEAILLQALGTKLTDRDGWTTIVLQELQQTLPFWSIDHITQSER